MGYIYKIYFQWFHVAFIALSCVKQTKNRRPGFGSQSVSRRYKFITFSSQSLKNGYVTLLAALFISVRCFHLQSIRNPSNSIFARMALLCFVSAAFGFNTKWMFHRVESISLLLFYQYYTCVGLSLSSSSGHLINAPSSNQNVTFQMKTFSNDFG